MPRPKRTLAEVDTNAEPVTTAKKPMTGRGKAKGKENEVPVTKKAPVAKATTKKSIASKAKKATNKKAKDTEPNSENELLVTDTTDRIPVPMAATMILNVLRAKKAASEKSKDNETDSAVPQIAPTVEVADVGEKADVESAKAVAAAAQSNDKTNEGIALPKSTKSVPASKSKSATKVRVSNDMITIVLHADQRS